jgi:hypothetical protein
MVGFDHRRECRQARIHSARDFAVTGQLHEREYIQ